MGAGYFYRCPKCGYSFWASTGVGFMFPMVYAETVQKAKKGELGKEIQDFFKEHEDGAINASMVILRCEDCGHLSSGMNLTMYVPNGKKPKKNEHGRWSVALPFEGADYVTGIELEEYYTESAKYPHKCENCGGRMIPLHTKPVCPECNTPLEEELDLLWD